MQSPDSADAHLPRQEGQRHCLVSVVMATLTKEDLTDFLITTP
jgi:hypothetical protein